ncbi:DUF302 domain-containing protein [Rhodosalinus halophilus]|uniref:DUF302 domain-containing protein n=1 Tax=Rhodosalinus halophilus TaxID=2259333 RepID=A0A365UAY3_9RHOB|nr:DUF302 domain-containing protein [Rhodosalinus halophilus]RBI85608.1 DUF302 domain-containing protein [Rhodosalinus halophilus]
MRKMLCAALALIAAPALADEDIVTYETDMSYGDVSFGLENAILDEGLVIDHVSHVGEMLARTREDVGSDVRLFEEADAYGFCSATVSREVMEADPMNIAYCPYHVFVMQKAGEDTVTIGYRGYPDGPMDAVEAMLDRIARNAIGLD